MPKYRITGDILHAGTVVIEAEDEDALLGLIDGIYVGEFSIEDEQGKTLAFQWDGNEPEPVDD